MHDYFSPAVSGARSEMALSRAARHRSRVAVGSDMRSRVTRPMIVSANRACARLALRRDDAVSALDHVSVRGSIRGSMAPATRHA